ncbi:MAG: hypothetical protein Q4Q22_08650, partial [Methanosphaera sp.]|nr:hypothetical protein [Methanosphaera sp.]
MKAKKIILLVTLLVVLVGVASASEVSNEALDVHTSDMDDTTLKESTPATASVHEKVISEEYEDTINNDTSCVEDKVLEYTESETTDVQESITTEGKEINKLEKDNKNLKQYANTYDVYDYTTFSSIFKNETGAADVLIYLQSDIILGGTTSFNGTLVIYGNGYTIDGNGEYGFIQLKTGHSHGYLIDTYYAPKIYIINTTITNCNNYVILSSTNASNISITNSIIHDNNGP